MSKSLNVRVRSSAVGPLVRRIEGLMEELGGPPSEWVVGVAKDPERALFATHRVEPATTPYVWLQADTPIAARAVARYFHEAGCLGRSLWDDQAFCVYAYRRGPSTWP